MRNVKINTFVASLVIGLALFCSYAAYRSVASEVYQSIFNSTDEAYQRGFNKGLELRKAIDDSKMAQKEKNKKKAEESVKKIISL